MVYARSVSGKRLYVNTMMGNPIMNGAVSRTHVSQLSWGLIPDQAKMARTIARSIRWYFFDRDTSVIIIHQDKKQNTKNMGVVLF